MKKTNKALAMLMAVLMVLSTITSTVSINAAQVTTKEVATEEAASNEKTTSEDSRYATGDIIVSEEEFSKNALTEVDTPSAISEDLDMAEQLPSNIDNSTKKYFPAIGNQGSVGSCGSWAVAYYQMTYMLNRMLNRSADIPAHIVSPEWVYNFCIPGDSISDGTLVTDNMEVLEKLGAATCEEIPLKQVQWGSEYITSFLDCSSWHPDKEIWKKASRYKIEGYKDYTFNNNNVKTPITGPEDADLYDIKKALADGEILTYSTCIGKWLFKTVPQNAAVPENNNYIGDEIAVSASLKSSGGHRMTIVGYNDNIWVDINGNNIVEAGEKGAFRIANSWGDDWKDGGFCWVSYDSLNKVSSVNNATMDNTYRDVSMTNICGIVMETSTEGAKLYAEIDLNSMQREQSRIYIIKTDAAGEVEKLVCPWSNTLALAIAGNRASAFPFDGSKATGDATFIIDLQEYFDITAEDLKTSKWCITCKDNQQDGLALNVKSIKFVDEINNKIYEDGREEAYTIDGGSVSTLIKNKASQTNKVTTIYYKGYNNPYIHYRVENGTWTTAPGVQMTPTTEKAGYDYKVVIPMYEKVSLEACFNNGSSAWDSNGGKNYNFGTGTYGYSNGKIVKFEEDKPVITDFRVDSYGDAKVGSSVYMSVQVLGGEEPYKYNYVVEDAAGNVLLDQKYDYSYYSGWTPTAAGTYKVTVKVTDAVGESVSKSKNIEIHSLAITSINTSVASPQKVGTAITLSVTTEYENTYRFMNSRIYEITKGNKTETIKEYLGVNAVWTPTEEGVYTIKASLTDFKGQYAEKIITYTISDETTNQTTIYYKGYENPNIHYKIGNGAWTTVPGIAMTASTEQAGYTHKVTIDLQEETTLTACFNDGRGSWDSNNGKNYSFGVGTYGYTNGTIMPIGPTPTPVITSAPTATPVITSAPTATPVITSAPTATPVITSAPTATPVAKDTTTIYYKGYSTPYIHYKVGNGNWTSVPGVKMTATEEQEGYTHKAVIELGTASNTTVCFNNGNGSWDSNNGKNYEFSAGVFGYKGGVIEELETPLKVSSFTTSSAVGGTNTLLRLKAAVTGGVAPYTYHFGYIFSGREVSLSSSNSMSDNVSLTPSQAGTYSFFVEVKDSEGTIVRQDINNFIVEGPKISVFKTSVASPQKVGTSIVITGKVANVQADRYNWNSYTVTKDGHTINLTNNTDDTATWTPTEEGTYTITYRFTDYLGKTMEQSMQYVISDITTNQTTIYYKGYTNPYIHYKIANGNWTNVPGIKMTATTEKTGYTHKITIDLGEESNLTACFNDGNGNWDSRNGANYSFHVGTYTYKSGSIVKID